MAGMKLWKIVTVLTMYVVSAKADLICKSYYDSIRCEPGKSDYILRRGLVSDNSAVKSIILQLCRIVEVELEAFENDPYLKQLDLSRNKLTDLKLGVFNGLKNLTSLRVSRNLLTKLPLGIFDQVPNLKRLDLSGNKITSLEVGIFDPLPKLDTLVLSQNGLLGKDLNPSLFNQNRKIRSIDISINNMVGTPENLLIAIQGLKTLVLNNCFLTEVPTFATRPNLKTMNTLQLKMNEIKLIVQPIFENLEYLDTLDLTGNKIEYINVAAFKQLKRLNTLEIKFNMITKIPDDFFMSLPRLKFVDLSYNFIEYVPVDIFLHKSYLYTLNLGSNKISFLDKDFFRKLSLSDKSKLRKLNIKDNPLQCACLLEIINERKKYGYKYDSDDYDGNHAVCSMTDEFICKRER